jgi:hypothetical protein
MGHTACTEPHCRYKGALYLLPYEHNQYVAVKITKNKVVLMVFMYYQILLQHISPLFVA